MKSFILRVLSFLLNIMHVLRTEKEPTIAQIMQSPRLSPPLRWLLKRRPAFELLSRLSRLMGDLVNSITYREFIHEVDGQKLFAVRVLPGSVDRSGRKHLHPEDGLLIYSERYEPHVVKLFKSLLNPRMKVVDVGALLGYYTLLASKRAKEVIAFEPNPFRFKYLVRALELNRWTNVEAYKLFVSSFDSEEKQTVALDSIEEVLENYHLL